MYRRLAHGDRYQIEALLGSGKSGRAISRQLQVNQSSISREIRKLQGRYNAVDAEVVTLERRKARYLVRRKIKGSLEAYVRRKIQSDWSPEQIAGRRKQVGLQGISHQSIYRYLERKKARGDKLWKHLRILRKERNDRKKLSWRPNKEHMFRRTSIEERPRIVEERIRLGDFERDTVFGKLNGRLLLSIVDRTSRKLHLKLIHKKSSELIHKATVNVLKNEIIHTITNDNGCEFWRPQKTETALKTKIYFSRAYRSWERGTNENTNGLIRQYFPKETKIPAQAVDEIKKVETLLNTRPRKCLGFKTPLEVHQKLSRVMR